MPVPVQCLPLDSRPALPKPGRAHVMGSDSHMLDTACVEGNGHSPSNDSPRLRSDVLDAADVQSSDDMGALSVRASAISDGCGSDLSSRHHHVDHFESRPISTRKSSTSIADKRVGSQQTPTLPNNQSRARNDFGQGRHNEKTSGRYESPSLGPRQPQPWDDESTHTMIPQLKTRPISQDQLVAEVKGIYAGLVMVETKCIEVGNVQPPNTETNATSKLNNEQWQALIALYRTLLHEHHDFFFASQHPSASPALRRLASKYAMPARMWRHGIHSFLELLRHRLPGHILMFLYLAYIMMALLLEMVPAFEDTWIECLSGLGRYRMAIEDDDIRDREAGTEVSHHWYSKASDGSPTGRLYHHLAILARPNALQQFFYYTKSLCARESIMTLSGPVRSKFEKLRWLLFSAERGPADLSYLHLVVVVLLHLTRTYTDIPRAVMFELLHLMHECLTLYRFESSNYGLGIAKSSIGSVRGTYMKYAR
ncbi:EST1-DNA-bind domain-containing protein [Fusarium keratoplasticum]|uniref:EST1-DNA-bind domain-containing protein n=1 Tax=Fusarium keratoplasticum TaxID=1328300 RepID=A0ACC0QS11_9HYPO|nr:EST1-DNA-bind domain-containing protein [Fusarium keratoplasticum]KAI8663541.1 EST1-DNA-bind domain-containing protein [Fusarium keratoplasticum]